VNADASTAGSRVTGFVTPVPSRIRCVAAAQKESCTNASAGRGLSLVPDAARSARDLMLAHYMKYEQVVTDWKPRDRPISRSQMELVASRTSAKNDCFY
jgi:hypothetical protein